MKLALGTVQFGVDYGAFGTGRQVARPQVTEILDLALAAGVDLLDTARAYGEAEAVIGAQPASEQFRIVTKCPPIAPEVDAADALLAQFEASCRALGVKKVAGYLLHFAGDIARPGVVDVLESLVADGRIERFGVSIYDFAEAEEICARYPVTLVQLPANVLVPWFRDRGLPETVEVHVRSAFLQGFLLSDPLGLSDRFVEWRSVLETFRHRAGALGLSPHQAALAPLLHSPYVHRVVVGCDTPAQLTELISAAATGPADLGDYATVTPELTDPRNWQRSRT
ncbi:MAG TPA: aldo/keto reductase [Candidatus Propionivibrio aalborgensis]|nr:aldo/keto reductase [Candidatus Propionivibrio aalborgensis]